MEAHLNNVASAEVGVDDAVDELLAIRCQLGEPEAFEELVDRWHVPLWKFARRLTESDDSARDVVQDIWLRVLRAMPRLRDPARLRAWLFGIARRALMDRLRDRYAAADVVPIDTTLAIPDDQDADGEELELLREELDRLPFIEREVLVLFYLREFSERQLSEVLDIPVGTVKSRLYRARRLLRQQLVSRGVQ